MKKQSGLFDVTMGAYDGVKVCELVGTYMLIFISEKYNTKDFRLLRDEELRLVKNKSRLGTDKIQKTYIEKHTEKNIKFMQHENGQLLGRYFQIK